MQNLLDMQSVLDLQQKDLKSGTKRSPTDMPFTQLMNLQRQVDQQIDKIHKGFWQCRQTELFWSFYIFQTTELDEWKYRSSRSSGSAFEDMSASTASTSSATQGTDTLIDPNGNNNNNVDMSQMRRKSSSTISKATVIWIIDVGPLMWQRFKCSRRQAATMETWWVSLIMEINSDLFTFCRIPLHYRQTPSTTP